LIKVPEIMPPRWPRKPDRADPEYRKLDDRMNFAIHVAVFAATNSGLWFFRVLGSTSELGAPGGLSITPWVTGIWGLVLFAHAMFIFAIAKYSEPAPTTGSSGTGFQPKSTKKPTKAAKK
jgi:hypothetical protein